MKYYTKQHEWCEFETHKIGLSVFAKNELGEIVYLKLPELNTQVSKGQELCILESTKSASDLYAPYSGIVTELNPEAINFINDDPEGKGWLVKITPSQTLNPSSYLTPENYQLMLED
jgi:glycine cleavage system H protein